MKDLSKLHHFLGVTVEPRQSSLVHQRQYVLDILERARMIDCKPCSTPVDTQAKLSLLRVILWILRPTRVLLALCSTSLSPGRNSHVI
jgi:hypothetical protein